MIAAHQTMLAPQGAPLPYDAEVEWLANATSTNQTTGIAWIDTGIDCGDNVGFEVDATRVNELSTDAVIFGTRHDSGNTRWFVGGVYNQKYYWGWNSLISAQTAALNQRHSFGLNFLNSRTATFDGVSVGSLSGTYNYSKRLYFCVNYSWQNQRIGTSSWRCHGGRISVGSTIVRNYKPVRIGTIGYWYDEISGTIHATQDGVFVVGPDKIPS